MPRLRAALPIPRFAAAAITLTLLAGVVPARVAGASAPRATPPSDWVSSMCTALSDWKDGLQSAVGDEQAALPAARRLHGSAQLRKAKQILQKLLRASVSESQKADKALHKLSAPDVANGSTILSTLLDGFDKALAGFQKARRAADSLSTTSKSAFTRQATRLGDNITALGRRVRAELDTIKGQDTSGAIATALSADPTCTSLSPTS
jgi:hypothetical protein